MKNLEKIFGSGFSLFILLQSSLTFGQNEGVSLGWEIEFKAGDEARENNLVVFPTRSASLFVKETELLPRIKEPQNFPFIEEEGIIEETGNIEIRSRPLWEKKDLVFKQLAQSVAMIEEGNTSLPLTLQSDVKSVHMHMRFNKSMISPLKEEELRAYVSRLGDIVFAWRLQYNLPANALKRVTQTRYSPSKTHLKGTVRLLSDDLIDSAKYQGAGGQYDIEVRGYMDHIGQLEKTIDLILAFVSLPATKHIFPYLSYQDLFYSRPGTFSQWVAKTLAERGMEITPAQKRDMDQMAKNATYKEQWASEEFFSSNQQVLLPMMGFEFDPTLTQVERRHIELENKSFAQKVVNLVQGTNLSAELLVDNKKDIHSLPEKFRQLIKDWAVNTNFRGLILESLNRKRVMDDGSLFRSLPFYQWLFEHAEKNEAAVLNILKTIPQEFILELYENKVLTLPQELQLHELLINAGKRYLYNRVQKKIADLYETSGCQISKSYQHLHKAEAGLLQFKRELMEKSDGETLTLEETLAFFQKLGEAKKWKKIELVNFVEKLKKVGLFEVRDIIENLHQINDRIIHYNAVHPQANLTRIKNTTLETIMDVYQSFSSK